MLEKLRPRSIYDVMASIACFGVLAGGTAYAANTIGSSDIINNSVASVDLKDGDIKAVDIGVGQVLGSRIVDSTVKTEDLADNRVATADLKDGDVRSVDVAANTLTGDDIAESSLGKVGDADTLDGTDSAGLVGTVQQSNSLADLCTVANEWRECAQVVVHVPAGRTYRIAIDSAGSFLAGASATVKLCASVRDMLDGFDGTGSTVAGCGMNIPTGVSLAANEMENAATNGVQTVEGGIFGRSFVVSTAVRPNQTLTIDETFDHAVVHTLVTAVEVPLLARAEARSKVAKPARRGR